MPSWAPGRGPGWRPQQPPAAPRPPQRGTNPGGMAQRTQNRAGAESAARGARYRQATGTQLPAGGGAPGWGSESGPTYLEQRYTDRLNGVDAAANYALKRGGDDIDRRMMAGGAFNSGARGQQLSDFGANVYAKSQEQLDQLAAGATGARQRKLESMFGQGLGIAGGMAGVQSLYDTASAGYTNQGNQTALGLGINKAGVDSQANQQFLNNVFSGLSLGTGFGGGPRPGGVSNLYAPPGPVGSGGGYSGGYGAYQPNGLISPSF